MEKESKLEGLPSFSLGLTQEEQEKEEEKNKVDKKVTGSRLRHKTSVVKVYDMVQVMNNKKRSAQIIDKIKHSGFGGILHICKWTTIHTFFVEWVVKNFDKEKMHIKLSKTKVLQLTEEDVHRVYELPRGGKKVDLSCCSEESIKNLRRELRLKGDYSPTVSVIELETTLKALEDEKALAKGTILFMIHNLLCPTNQSLVTLEYAHILQDLPSIASYNWCDHVLEHVREGISKKDVKNPVADFHFLMINYMDKMGKESPFLTGRYKRPSLCDWNVSEATKNLSDMNKLMGLDRALTAGVTKIGRVDGPTILPFDADTCPLNKAQKHANYCREQIKIYSTCLETLERRLGEGSHTENVSGHGEDKQKKKLQLEDQK